MERWTGNQSETTAARYSIRHTDAGGASHWRAHSSTVRAGDSWSHPAISPDFALFRFR